MSELVGQGEFNKLFGGSERTREVSKLRPDRELAVFIAPPPDATAQTRRDLASLINANPVFRALRPRG